MKGYWDNIILLFRSHPKFWQRTGLVILSLVLFVILTDGVFMPIWVRQGADTTVPNIMGLDFEKASDSLKQASLRIEKIGEKFDLNHPAGTVIFQIPDADSRVKKDRIVKVTLSRGGETVIVPQLKGEPLEEAQLKLEESDLRLGEIAYTASDSVSANCVITTYPQPGSKVPVGMIINLVVNPGKTVDSTIVPEVIGRSLSEARKLIQKNSLKLGSIRQKVDEALLPETILAQSLAPGEKVPRGTKIDLIVSTLEQ